MYLIELTLDGCQKSEIKQEERTSTRSLLHEMSHVANAQRPHPFWAAEHHFAHAYREELRNHTKLTYGGQKRQRPALDAIHLGRERLRSILEWINSRIINFRLSRPTKVVLVDGIVSIHQNHQSGHSWGPKVFTTLMLIYSPLMLLSMNLLFLVSIKMYARTLCYLQLIDRFDGSGGCRQGHPPEPRRRPTL